MVRLFIIFYILATAVVSAQRVSLDVDRLRHGPHAGLHLESPRPGEPLFPKFHQAKTKDFALEVRLRELGLERPITSRGLVASAGGSAVPLGPRDKRKPARSPPIIRVS